MDTGFTGFRIVGCEVEPYSMNQHVKATGDGEYAAICGGGEALRVHHSDTTSHFDLDVHDEIAYTYSVSWTESPIRWASRWDSYLKMTGTAQIHWFSLLNSMMIMIFLSGIVAMIILRTLHRDIAKYNEISTAEEAAEETGWKLVHGDVFRKPTHSKLLVVTIGSGVQILGMAIVTLIFAVLGFLSPAHRGGLLQSMMFLFTFMGIFAGYCSSRLYKTLGGEDWKVTTLLTALLYPGMLFNTFFILNLFIWGEKSSGAVPFLTMFAILVLWFGISVPLVFLGAYFGFKAQPIELPVRVNQIPRQVPFQPWFFNPVINSLLGGMLPFGAAFTELFFIMTSIWMHQFYYLFGFLFLMMFVLTITCAEISISITYFQLSAENYHWWWRAFFVSGAAGVYVFGYSVLYFLTRLSIDKTVSIILYFGYMWIFSVLFGVLTGSIGFISSFIFVRIIYSSVKVD